MPGRSRLSATERKTRLTKTAIELARRDGIPELTLTRVAEADDVSKPVAYQHFGTLGGLFQCMLEELEDEYENKVLSGLRSYAATGEHSPTELLQHLIEIYIDCSLDTGALLDEVGAALHSLDPNSEINRLDFGRQYAPFVSEMFSLDDSSAYQLAVVFIGAIDRVCEAVIANRMSRTDAINIMIQVFNPALLEARARSLAGTDTST